MYKMSGSVHINESDEDSGDDDWRGIRHQDSQSIKEIEISRYTKISDETDVLRSPAINGTPQEFYQSLSPPVIKTEPITEELDIDHYIYREGSFALDDEDEHSADSTFYNAETLTLPKISETPEKLNSMENFYQIKEEEIMEDIENILPLFIDQRSAESKHSPRASESEFVIKTEPIDELVRDDDSCCEPTYRSMSPIQSPLAGDDDNFQEALDDDLREILPLFVDKRKDSDDELQEIVNEVENSLDEKLHFRNTFFDDFVLEEDEKNFANSSSSSDRLTSDEEYVFSSLVKAVDFPVPEDSSEDEVSEYETSSEAEGDFSDENISEKILRGNDGLENFILQNPKDKERIMIGKVTQSTVESSETPGDDDQGDFSLEDKNEMPEVTNGSSDGKNFMEAISSVEIHEGRIFPQNSSTVSEMSIISDYQASAEENSTDLNNSQLQMVVDSEAGEIAGRKEILSYVSDEFMDIFGENGGNGDILKSTGDILENDVQIPNDIPSAKGNEQEFNSENIVKLTENLPSANISPGIEKDLRSGFSTTMPLSTEENIAQLIETLISPEIESSESSTLKIDEQTEIIHHDNEKKESAEKIHISEEILQNNVVSAEEEKVIPGEAVGSSEALQISQRDVSADIAEEKIPEKMTESTSMNVPQLVSTDISPTKKEENTSENREFPNEIDYPRIPITEETEIPQEITSMPLIVDESVDLDEAAVAKSHSLDVPSEEPTERVSSSEKTSESIEIHILNENCGEVPSEAPQEEINTEKTDEIEVSAIAAVSDDIVSSFVMTNEENRNFGDINSENALQKGSDDDNESDSLIEMSSMEIHDGISRATDEIDILQNEQLNIPSIEGNSDEDDEIILQPAKVLSNLSEFPSKEINLHDSEENDEKSSEIHKAAGASPVITEINSPAPESLLRTFSIENIDEHMENEEIGQILVENDEQKEELPNVDAVDEQSATDEDECSELKASEPVLTSSTVRCEEENREESQVDEVQSFGTILQAPKSPSISSEYARNGVDVEEDLNIGKMSNENVEIILENGENEKNGGNLNNEGNEENDNHEENVENEKEGEDKKKEGNERIFIEYEDMTEASPHFAISATELTLTPPPTIDDNQVLAESATNGDVSSESSTEVPESISTSSLVNNGDDDEHVENECTSTISEFSSMTLPVSSDDEKTVENSEKSPFPGTDENSVEIAEIEENYEITSCDNDKNVESAENAGNNESSSTISESSSMTSCVSTDDRKTPENTEDEGNHEKSHFLSAGEESGEIAENKGNQEESPISSDDDKNTESAELGKHDRTSSVSILSPPSIPSSVNNNYDLATLNKHVRELKTSSLNSSDSLNASEILDDISGQTSTPHHSAGSNKRKLDEVDNIQENYITKIPRTVESNGNEFGCNDDHSENDNASVEVLETTGDGVEAGELADSLVESLVKENYEASPPRSAVEFSDSPMMPPAELNVSPVKSPMTVAQFPTKSPTRLDESPIKSPAKLNDSPIDSLARLNDSPMKSPARVNDSPIRLPAVLNNSPIESSAELNDSPIGSSEELTDSPMETSEKRNESPMESPEDNNPPSESPQKRNDSPIKLPVKLNDAPIEPPADLNDSPIESSAKSTDSSMESPKKRNDSPIKSPAKHNDSSTKSPTRRDDSPIENSIAETPVSQKRKPSRRINSSDEENDSRSQLTSSSKKRRKLFIRSDSVQELYTMPDEKTSQATLQSSVAAPKRIREKRQFLFNSDTQDVLKQVLHKFKMAEQGNVIESSGEILNSAVQPTESSRIPLSEVFIQNAGGFKISPEIDDHAPKKSVEIHSQPLTQEILPETLTQASNWTPNLPPPLDLEDPDGIDNEVEMITEKISGNREEDEICQRILTPPPLFRELQTNDNADNEKLPLSDDIQLRNELRDETLSPPSSRQSSVCVEDDADDNIVGLPQENSRISLMCAPKVVQQGGKVVLVPRDGNSTSPRGNPENSHRPEVRLKDSVINDEPLRSNDTISPDDEEAKTSQNNEISMKENETPAENIDEDKNTLPTDDLELSPDESEENVVSALERDNEESENIFRTPIRKPKFLNQFLTDELSKQNEQLNSDDESIAGCSTRPPSSRMSEDSDYQSLDGQSLDGKSQHVYAPKVVKLKGVKRKRTSVKFDEEDEEMIAEEVEDEVPSTQPESSRNNRIGKRSKGHVRATYKVVKTLVDDLAKCPTAENEVPDPDGFMAGIKLHPHQKHALIWMQWREGCTPPGGILADDMGLGKTIETIALILASLNEDERVKNCKMGESSRTTPGGTLIVCPANVVTQWQDEFMLKVKKRALSIFKFHYDQKEHRKSVLADFDVVITSYETLNKNLKDRGVFSKIHWRRVVLDEGHKIKNDKTEISKCVTKLDSDKRWVLTGTPVHNGKRDLYAIFRFLKLESFEISNIFNTWIDNDNHWGITRLNKILSAIMLRRTKQDYQAKNPDSKLFSKKYIVIHKIELSADERQAYDCVMKQTKQQLLVKLNNQQVPAKVLASSGIVTTNHVLTMIMRLRQMCVHPCLIWKQVAGEMAQEIQATKLKLREALDCINKTDEQIKIDHPIFDEDNLSTKLKAVLQKIQEITENEDKVIVVSEFVQVLNLIALHLKKRPNAKDDYEFYTGITKSAERAKVVRKFNDVCSTKILLLSLKAGGQGLNLMAANHVIIVDVHWNPQLENQAHDRVHRIGQTKDVYIHKFLCNDSIEERIVALQQIKIDIADAALAGTAGSNRFCDDELRFLFDVRK